MGYNYIKCGDCSELINELENDSVDLVLTSPPYNIIRNATDRGYDVYKDGMSIEEYNDWIISLINAIDRVLKPNGSILWNMSYGNENNENLWLLLADIINKTNFTIAEDIIRKKTTATPNAVSHNKLTRICEHIFVLCRKSEYMTFNGYKETVSVRSTGQKMYANVYNFITAPNNDGHTDLNMATFSTKLVKQLLKIYSKEDDVVLDVFMGTGTTALGCVEMNRKYIGFELSEAQCKYAEDRLNLFTKQVNMFDFLG